MTESSVETKGPSAPTGGDRSAYKAHARGLFDAWAHRYDRSLVQFFLFQPCYLAMLQEVRRWFAEDSTRGAAPSPGRPRTFRAVDIGCGTATFAKFLLETRLPLHVMGLDYSSAMCAVAAKKLRELDDRPGSLRGGAEILAGDSEHLPFADASVDLLTCANSFHHYPRQSAVIAEMRRVLRPGGRLILLDGFRDNVIGWFVFDVIVTALEKQVHHATWKEVRDMFRSVGFRDVRQRKFNILFPVLVTTGDV